MVPLPASGVESRATNGNAYFEEWMQMGGSASGPNALPYWDTNDDAGREGREHGGSESAEGGEVDGDFVSRPGPLSEIRAPGSAADVERPSTDGGGRQERAIEGVGAGAQGYHCAVAGCKRQCKRKGDLKRHVKETHESARGLLCPIALCPRGIPGRGFKRMSQLTGHLQSGKHSMDKERAAYEAALHN